jgi:hypothetical protein
LARETRQRFICSCGSDETCDLSIEEEIFYLAVRKAIDDSGLMDEALVEHAVAKDLIAQLEDTSPEDDLYEVTVLGEQIDHHVKEEEGDMLPALACKGRPCRVISDNQTSIFSET